jgi:thiamine-phosphate pyrophosphorylase
MPTRHPLPRLWLMTDERQGESLMEALGRLPRGAGIVFRHYGLAAADRRALFDRVLDRARQKDMLLLLSGSAAQARDWGADGSHGRGRDEGLRSAPAHDLQEIRAAERDGAALVFLSPIFRTRSHPGVRPLGPDGFAALARQTRLPVVALGGMDENKGQALARLGAYGWAGIDAWSA